MPDPNFNWHRTLICQLFIILFKKNLRRLVFRDSMVFKTFHSQDINFWGNVYPTFVALPYLHQSNGRIIINASPLHAPDTINLANSSTGPPVTCT